MKAAPLTLLAAALAAAPAVPAGQPPAPADLDSVSPNHPALYHAGPAGVANSAALKHSGVTKDTPNPPAGLVEKDPATGEPTGMLRNAYGVLKGVPGSGGDLSPEQRR